MVAEQKKPLVSVVVLTYNQQSTVGRTLDSILAQRGDFEMEVLIGEDASPDGTRAVCERYVADYPDVVRLMPAAPNKGLLRNYVDTLRATRGEYVACCAGDDWWNGTDSLARKVAFLEANPDYGVVHTDHDILHVADNRLETAHRKARGQWLHGDDNVYRELMTEENPSGVAALTVLMRRDLLERHMEWDEYLSRGFMMEDLPQWLELSRHTRFRYLDFSSATYRLAEGSACNNNNDFLRMERFAESSLAVKLYFLDKYPLAGLTSEILRQRHIRDFLFTAIDMCNEAKTAEYLRRWHPSTPKDRLRKLVLLSPVSGIYRRRLRLSRLSGS